MKKKLYYLFLVLITGFVIEQRCDIISTLHTVNFSSGHAVADDQLWDISVAECNEDPKEAKSGKSLFNCLHFFSTNFTITFTAHSCVRVFQFSQSQALTCVTPELISVFRI